MENLERALLSELRNYLHIDVGCFSKKIIIDKKFDIDDTVSDMIYILLYRFNYSIEFNRVFFNEKTITYLSKIGSINNYYIQFTNCIYDKPHNPVGLEIASQLSSNLIVKRVCIDLGTIDIETIKENKDGFQSLKFDSCIIYMSSTREIQLKHNDIKKIIKNKKKVSIGCKAMTLKNWVKFFKEESHQFKTKRGTLEFQEIKLGFEKFLLLIQ